MKQLNIKNLIIALVAFAVPFTVSANPPYLVRSIEEVISLFPKTPQEIKDLCETSVAHAQQDLNALVTIPHHERTFDNTALARDEINRQLTVALCLIHRIGMVHPDEAMRTAAHQACIEMNSFGIHASLNPDLYNAFHGLLTQGKAVHYIKGQQERELTAEERYYLDQTMKDFKRAGFGLPPDKFARVKQLHKEVDILGSEFSKAIADDNRYIEADITELAGVSQTVLHSLATTENGKYKVGCDYPTYHEVMGYCTVGETRKRLSLAFKNRAYPDNIERLETIIQKRDELAKVLGFPSFAHLDTDDQMVKTPERAEQFLSDLLARARDKELKEFELLTADLPAGVSLTAQGQFEPWDFGFVRESYKKKHFSYDARKVAEYFPVQTTVQGIFDIYQQFLGVQFEVIPIKGLWTENLQCIVVKDSGSGTLRGFIILDLYPRSNKYKHACHAQIIPSLRRQGAAGSTFFPAVTVIIANFPKATADAPSLLKHSDVVTFFHEFGHAMHWVLGTTGMNAFAGTRVKRDFSEMPSQMFEEWMRDKEMLKRVGKHYKTGQVLPDELIDSIVKLTQFGSGMFVQGQAMMALLALEYFKDGAVKDTQALYQQLSGQHQPHFRFDEQDHFQAAFDHLIGYGSKYYGYLWSQVFAHDLFARIKEHGLLDPVIGQEFVQKVLGKGGSAEPDDLLKDFLGREPNQEAFFKNMGFA